jgi:hypothetical protein
MFALLYSWQKKLFVDNIMTAISIIVEAIPNFIPISINFEILKSQGIEIINSPTFVIFKFFPTYFLNEAYLT